MICRNGGEKRPDDADFCSLCGVRPEPDSALHGKPDLPPQNSAKPQKRRKADNREKIKPPPFPMRIILTLCSLILFCVTIGSLLVNFVGKNAEATILDTSCYGRCPNEKYLYKWDVTYEFYVNGKKYTDTDQLIGPEGSINTFGYHVSYLSFAPEVSRLSRETSVAELRQLSDILQVGSGAVFFCILQFLISYFLLWNAFPKLPFFGFGRKKKKKRKSSHLPPRRSEKIRADWAAKKKG